MAAVTFVVTLAAGAVQAGEIVVVEPGRAEPAASSGGIVIIEPGRPDTGPVDNRTNLDKGLDRAKAYSGTGPQSGGLVIVTPGSGNQTAAPDAARDNAASLERNRARAKAYSKGGQGTTGQGTTILIMPQGGQVMTDGPDHGHPSNATNVDINAAKAKAYMEGQGGQRLGCSSSNVMIGTVGGTAINGNQTTIVTDGVNAWAVGPNCN